MAQTVNQQAFAVASATVGHPLNAVQIPGGFLPSTTVSAWSWTSGASTYQALVHHGLNVGIVRETVGGSESVCKGVWDGSGITITMAGGGTRVVTPS